MRILVVSSLYPPVAVGGYEVECSAVVEHLREDHEVVVLTSGRERRDAPSEIGVRRELPWLAENEFGALTAPAAAVAAASRARRALETSPDLVYVWNGSGVPHAAIRVIADSGTPLAFRVCEHWFGRLFTGDQFLRELRPAKRGPPRAGWAAICRAWNLLPALRLDPTARFPAAVSWNGEAVRRIGGLPPAVIPALERVHHSVPRHGAEYAAIVRDPSPEPEILYIGRVTPAKGVEVAIRALAALRETEGISARLVVAGPVDRGYGSTLRRIAASLAIEDRIDWTGQLPPERVAGLLSRASALIVPSVWEEPFPLVTIEGAFARVPLVASDVGGIGEGMRDIEHALLFPPGDHLAASAALARVITEQGETAERVARARDRALDFQLDPYLRAQADFVEEAYQVLSTDRR